MSDQQFLRGQAVQKAQAMWQDFTDNEKAGVRFGMFPAAKMLAAEKEGHHPRFLAVALMDVAKANGGMIA